MNSSGVHSRLLEISTRLAVLNERFRTGLETLRQTSIAISDRAETSNQELEGLREALTKAESSLMNLEQSFAAYRMSAEARIARLESRGRLFKYGFFAALLLALSR
jgi:predicted  nucleic acid-binding Zn-ribbon protein